MRRYLLVIPIAAAVFMGLAIAHQYETFLPLLGLSKDPRAFDKAEAARAVGTVRAFCASLQKAHHARSPTPLRHIGAALKAKLGRTVFFARSRGDTPPRLAAFELVRVAPAGKGSWTVLTREDWRWPASKRTRAHRSWLRWHYALATVDKKLQITEMQARLPDPARGKRKANR